jgi:hypothetical protein
MMSLRIIKMNKIALGKNQRKSRKKNKKLLKTRVILSIPMRKKTKIKFNSMDKPLKMLFKPTLLIGGKKIASMICLEIWMKMKRGDSLKVSMANLVILTKKWKTNKNYLINA